MLADRDALASGVVQDAGSLLHGLLCPWRHGGVLVAIRLRGRSAAAAAAAAAARQAVLCTCRAHSIHLDLLLRAAKHCAKYYWKVVKFKTNIFHRFLRDT